MLYSFLIFVYVFCVLPAWRNERWWNWKKL